MAMKAQQDFTDNTLELVTIDATQLLAALGALPEARTVMLHAGMTDNDIIEGRTLIFDVLAQPKAVATIETAEAVAQRSAVAELDSWDEPNFARYGAALARHNPDAGEYVFGNIKAGRGFESVHAIAAMLTSIDALESGSDPARADKKREDKKAVELLAKRGLDKNERKRLHGLVDVALGPTPALDSPSEAALNEERRAKLLKLKLWYNEWATVAHAVVKKRSQLIRMGLATRRSAAKTPTEPQSPPVPA